MSDNKNTYAENDEININADADVPGNTHLSNDEDEVETEHENALNQLEEQKEKYLRLFAEFDNYKRRTAKERLEIMQTAGKDILVAMLDVMDDCDRAEKQMEESDDLEQVIAGNKLVFSKLRNTLHKQGLTPMESIGEEFDVEKHEAITEIEAGEKMKGKVVDVVQKGYYLNNKLVRFAKVVVGK